MTQPKTARLADMRGAMCGSLLAQGCFLAFSALILDGGALAFLCMAGMVGHWSLVAYFAIRRRNALTEVDQALVKAGFVLFALLIILELEGVVEVALFFGWL